MIISLRGTNGAGKSTLVRNVMARYDERFEHRTDDIRRRPLGYVLHRKKGRSLFVPGHYEIANGGVDTLPGLDFAYGLIREFAGVGYDVLYEGKNMSDGTGRLMELKNAGLDVRVVLMDIPVEKAIASVRERGHQIKVETIEKLHHKCSRDVGKFSAEGVTVYHGGREFALRKVKDLLEL